MGDSFERVRPVQCGVGVRDALPLAEKGVSLNYRTLRFDEPEPRVGLVTLNRPDRLNALNMDMLDELEALFDQLQKNEKILVVIITGAGRGFCSGADLKDVSGRKDFIENVKTAGNHLIQIQKKYARIIIRVRELPQPVIAAVNGPAAGGGMSFALAADVVFASKKAVFIPSFINIGLSGGELGTSYFLPRAVGRIRASEILMTGRTVGAEEAERIGLANYICDHDGLTDAAMNHARLLISKGGLSLRLTKESLNLNLDAPSLISAMELENRTQSICCTMPEFHEAVERFGR